MKMKIGKLSEPILIRSVLKQVKHRRDEVLVGPAVGQDCAVVEIGPDEVFVMSTDPITGTAKDLGSHCIHVTANDLAAGGAEPVGVMLTVMLPNNTKETVLKEIIHDAEEVCESLNMEILGGHTEVTNAVCKPLVSVTGVGKMKRSQVVTIGDIKPEQDIVLTKWIGLEATVILAKEKEEELAKRFPCGIVDTAKEFSKYLSVVPESKIAMAHGVSSMHDVTEGGVFGALWEMVNSAGLGMEVELKKIPIRQETVEICEYFGLNPYLIMSSGSMMITTDDGNGLVRKLEKEGIHATIIGRTNASNDKILLNGEEVRYLDKPQPDELYKILG